MRNHQEKFERFECGEGPTCGWAWVLPAIGAVAGAVGGMQQRKAQKEANKANQETYFWADPAAQRFDKRLMGDAEGLYANQQMVPGPTPLEYDARQGLLNAASGPMAGLINAGNASLLQGMDPTSTYNTFAQMDPMQFLNPHVDEMIGIGLGRLGDTFNERILPAIKDRSQANGGYGGSAYAYDAAMAKRDTERAMADYDKQMRSAAFDTAMQNHLQLANSAIGAQQSAWGVLPALTALNRMPADIQSEVAERQRQDLALPYRNLMAAQGFLDPYRSSTPGAAATPVDANPITGALQGLGLGYNLMNTGNTAGNVG